MAIHQGQAIISGSATLKTTAEVVRVTTTSDLGRALQQRDKPVIIEDKRLKKWFELFVRYQNWWIIGALLAYAISMNYGVTFRKTDWYADHTEQWEIILTPSKK